MYSSTVPLRAQARALGLTRSPGAREMQPLDTSPCCTSRHGIMARTTAGTACFLFCGCGPVFGRCLSVCILASGVPLHISARPHAFDITPVQALQIFSPCNRHPIAALCRRDQAWAAVALPALRDACAKPAFQHAWLAPSLIQRRDFHGLICPVFWWPIHGLELNQTDITSDRPPPL